MIVILLLLWAALLDAKSNRDELSVYYNGGEWSYRPGIDNNAVAYGWLQPTMFTIGWDQVQLTSNNAHANHLQAYGAGFVEGYLTWESVQNRFTQLRNKHPESGLCRNAQAEVDENIKFVERMVAKEKDSYWLQISLVWEQLHGLVDGYNNQSATKLDFADFFCIQAYAELGDWERAQPNFPWPDFGSFSERDWNDWEKENLHCSSLIKVNPDLSELYFGHTTWSGYDDMLRQIKVYNLPYRGIETAAEKVIMSSYPGTLVSIDDFYVLSSGLSVIETTIGVYNQSLFTNYVHPGSQVPYWLRITVSNRMATEAAVWPVIFSKYNSGTYNNQWIIVDVKKFQPGKPLPAGTLYIAEQIPGFVDYADQTDILQFGYWPSYNVPFYPFIWNMANYTKTAPHNPKMVSYQACVRAEIFRRNETDAGLNLDSYKDLMRYNNYKVDPLSFDNPGYAIASRYDLSKTSPGCWGATDTKVSSASLYHQGMVMHAISGPTRSHGLPAFNWGKPGCNGPPAHYPPVYDFDFEEFMPEQM